MSSPGRWFRCVRVLSACGLMSVAAACATVPDAAPFADATTALRSAVVASGGATDNALRAGGFATSATMLAGHWTKRVDALDAAVEYSHGLASIAAAGRSGAESMRALGDSLGKLATAAGVPDPATTTWGPALAVVREAAEKIWEQIAAVRANDALERQMTAAQPVLDRLAGILAQDERDLADVIRAAYAAAETDERARHQADAGLLLTLQDARKELGSSFVDGASGKVKVAALLAEGPNLAKLDEIESQVRARLAPRDARLAALRAEAKAASDLPLAAGVALVAWSKAHQQLLDAVRAGRQVNVAALLQAVEEVRELARKVRDL